MIPRPGAASLLPFAALAALLAVEPASAQPSYPKLLMTGNGLGVSRINLARKIGSSWGPVGSMYVNGGQYRVRIRVTNFYPPFSGKAFQGGYTDKITKIGVEVVVPGPPLPPATSPTEWFSSSSFSGSGKQGIFQREDYTPLDQGRSRTYTAYFKWIGPNAPAGSVKVNVWGAEENRLFVRSANLAPTP
ncbi:MAG: hypothetical protein AB7R55_16810 [Gemmatimonadales bacterium]